MLDPLKSAKAAGLKYTTDHELGLLRKKSGKYFSYYDQKSGKVIRDQKLLSRIKSLVIPPAWKEVWICKEALGHLQVTGRDKRNRKQYRYHDKWTVVRNSTKFDRMGILATKIPLIKKKIEDDLKLSGIPREKVIAAVIKVMLITRSRIGNSEYAQENSTYGLTTILNEHATIKGKKIQLKFKGKSGVDHDIEFNDETLAKIIKRCQELPGEELFAFVEDDKVIDINSQHINNYLKEVTGEDFTAKDLRTWSGTCKAISLLIEDCLEESPSQNQLKKRHVGIIKATANYLRNTVAVCRKYYIHPIVFNADENLILKEIKKQCVRATKFKEKEERIFEMLLNHQITSGNRFS